VRAFGAVALILIGCTGDILPIALPGAVFVTEAGNLEGPMHEVRGGFEGPVAAGGGFEPTLLDRREGAWLPLSPPPNWRGAIRDVTVVQGVAFIAGDAGQIGTGNRSGLEELASGVDFPLNAVFARAADDVFFAGTGGLLHYDGASVSPIDTSSATDARLFHSVWGMGSTLFVAGAEGIVLSVSGASIAPTDTGTTATLRALHGRSRTEIYAAGGDDRGAVLRWDGIRWNDMALPFMPPLHAVFAGQSGVWVCGDAGYLANWDGQRWIEIESGTALALTGAYEEDGDLFLTGGNILDPVASGFIARYGE
jgi:hypothetical protein